jgi:hypothetical protein
MYFVYDESLLKFYQIVLEFGALILITIIFFIQCKYTSTYHRMSL